MFFFASYRFVTNHCAYGFCGFQDIVSVQVGVGSHKSTLNISTLGDGALTELGLTGEDVLVNSLFLR